MVSGLRSSSKQAIDMLIYSRGPIHSIAPSLRFTTPQMNRAGAIAMKIPGHYILLCEAEVLSVGGM